MPPDDAPGQLFRSFLLGLVSLRVLAGGLPSLRSEQVHFLVVLTVVPVSHADPRVGTEVVAPSGRTPCRGSCKSLLIGIAASHDVVGACWQVLGQRVFTGAAGADEPSRTPRCRGRSRQALTPHRNDALDV